MASPDEIQEALRFEKPALNATFFVGMYRIATVRTVQRMKKSSPMIQSAIVSNLATMDNAHDVTMLATTTLILWKTSLSNAESHISVRSILFTLLLQRLVLL